MMIVADSSFPDWLPPLVLFSDYHGNWDQYFEALYAFFRKDFLDSKPYFRGTRIKFKKHPYENGKEATFWHLISEGRTEEDRIPDFRRCERIRWPRPMIENEHRMKCWKNIRKNEERICLWLEEAEYLVVLLKEGDIYFCGQRIWSLSPIEKENSRKNFKNIKKLMPPNKRRHRYSFYAWQMS